MDFTNLIEFLLENVDYIEYKDMFSGETVSWKNKNINNSHSNNRDTNEIRKDENLRNETT